MKNLHGPYQWMIEANISRFKEGARVLEDIARFVLKDKELFMKIKNLKHLVQTAHPDFMPEKDMGGADFVEKNQRHTLMDIVIANGRRMQEAARVLEEIYDRHYFKKIRFLSYEIYTLLLMRLKKYFKQEYLNGIYAICDPEKNSIENMAMFINQSSFSMCQIRMKSSNKRKCFEATQAMRSLLTDKTLLIVNDHLDIALQCADGVHLGQDDFPLEEARAMTPPDFIIGASCHSIEEAEMAVNARASYISVGCLYPTYTKPNAISTSIDTLKAIVEFSPIPVCAIGGINQNNIVEVKQTHVHMIAMQSDLWETFNYF